MYEFSLNILINFKYLINSKILNYFKIIIIIQFCTHKINLFPYIHIIYKLLLKFMIKV